MQDLRLVQEKESCMILGSPRSGTSVTSRALSLSGYFTGINQLHANEFNPHGFFESIDVIKINAKLLINALKQRQDLDNSIHPIGSWFYQIPRDIEIEWDEKFNDYADFLKSKSPIAIKDPRFSYTFAPWAKKLNINKFICTFREPSHSITGMSDIADRLSGFIDDFVNVDFKKRDWNPLENLERAKDKWISSYERILEKYSRFGEWLFLHYDQICSAEGKEKIENFLNVSIKGRYFDPSLRRVTRKMELPKVFESAYRELCRLAQHEISY